MTDDQQFILSMWTVIVPTIAAALAALQSRSTHSAVNGLLVKNMRRSRAAGRKQGQRESRVGNPPTSVGKTPTRIDGKRLTDSDPPVG